MKLFWIRFEIDFLYMDPPFTIWLTAQGWDTFIYCGFVRADGESQVKEALRHYCHNPQLRFCIERDTTETGNRFQQVDCVVTSLTYLPQQFQGAYI